MSVRVAGVFTASANFKNGHNRIESNRMIAVGNRGVR